MKQYNPYVFTCKSSSHQASKWKENIMLKWVHVLIVQHYASNLTKSVIYSLNKANNIFKSIHTAEALQACIILNFFFTHL